MVSHRYFAILFWLAIGVSFSLAMVAQPPQIAAATGVQVQEAVTAVLTVNDKMQHLLVFATLAGLAMLAWPRARGAQLLIGLSAYGALIELAQSLPIIGGDVEWADWFTDTSGVLAVLVAAGLARHTRALVAAPIRLHAGGPARP